MEKALLVSSSHQAVELLLPLIKEAGYMHAVVSETANEARRLVANTEYDLIVINTPLSDEFGHDLAVMLAERSYAGIILLCKSDISDEVCDRMLHYGVYVVPKPLNKTVFYQSVKLATATKARMFSLMQEYNKLQTKMEEIRLVDRAKCVLIQYLKLTEPQAHKYIEKQAMDTRQTKKEVAQRILTTYEM